MVDIFGDGRANCMYTVNISLPKSDAVFQKPQSKTSSGASKRFGRSPNTGKGRRPSLDNEGSQQASSFASKAMRVLGEGSPTASPPSRYQAQGYIVSPGLFVPCDMDTLEHYACKSSEIVLSCKQAIATYVQQYRDDSGKPLVSDEEFQELVEIYEGYVSFDVVRMLLISSPGSSGLDSTGQSAVHTSWTTKRICLPLQANRPSSPSSHVAAGVVPLRPLWIHHTGSQLVLKARTSSPFAQYGFSKDSRLALESITCNSLTCELCRTTLKTIVPGCLEYDFLPCTPFTSNSFYVIPTAVIRSLSVMSIFRIHYLVLSYTA